MKEQLAALQDFVDEVRAAEFKHVLVLGMGGSSLASEVLEYTFGIAPEHPNLAVLDTTDPATVLEYLREMNPQHTLYLVSSKAGTTLETLSFYKYFYGQVSAVKGDRAGENFVAITDPGTPLEKLAQDRNFRRIFLNPADIGGRYSALSYFGLVPAALMGIDLGQLLDRAEEMIRACEAGVPAEQNPGLWLETLLGGLYSKGRDKVTLVLSPRIQKFGYWVEQLLAESTGKASETTGQGVGLVPVVDEPIGAPEVYGDDRVFVYLCLDGDTNSGLDRGVDALEKAGQPVIRINLKDTYDLGGEFFRWEFATAVAGALMHVNAFDEPNVAESKALTSQLLNDYKQKGRLPEPAPLLSQNGILLYWNQSHAQHDKLEDYVRDFLGQAKPHDYIGLMAYLTHSPASDHAFTATRIELRARYHLATTFGYGPRFLHSTGQSYKGGANEGLFIQVTSTAGQDERIPGEGYSFGVLNQAQALGDWQALQNHQRRVLRLHIAEGTDISVLPQLINSVVASPASPQDHPDGIVSALGGKNVPTTGAVNAPTAEPRAAPSRSSKAKKQAGTQKRASAKKGTSAKKTSTTGRRTARSVKK